MKQTHCNSFVPLLTCSSIKEKKNPKNFGAKSWPFSRASIWKRCQNAYELRRRQLGTQIVHLVLFRNLVKLQRMAQVPVVVLDRGNNTTCTINLHGSTIVSWRVNNQVRQFLKVFFSYVAISRSQNAFFMKKNVQRIITYWKVRLEEMNQYY